MEKDGVENGEIAKPERDAKGRFISGGPGGPGRSVKTKKPISFKDIELTLQDDLKSKDAKIRHNATKLLLALKKAMVDVDDDVLSILDPRLQNAFAATMSGILEDPGVQEVDDEGISD